MNKDDLLKLRQNVVEAAQTAAVDGDAPAEVRLPIVLELARDSSDISLLRKAYELAGQIEEQGARVDALLDVLAAIDEQVVLLDDVSVDG